MNCDNCGVVLLHSRVIIVPETTNSIINIPTVGSSTSSQRFHCDHIEVPLGLGYTFCSVKLDASPHVPRRMRAPRHCYYCYYYVIRFHFWTHCCWKIRKCAISGELYILFLFQLRELVLMSCEIRFGCLCRNLYSVEISANHVSRSTIQWKSK